MYDYKLSMYQDEGVQILTVSLFVLLVGLHFSPLLLGKREFNQFNGTFAELLNSLPRFPKSLFEGVDSLSVARVV